MKLVRYGLIVIMILCMIPLTDVKAKGFNDHSNYIQDNGLVGFGLKDDVNCKATFSKQAGKTVRNLINYGDVPILKLTDDSVLKVSPEFLERMKSDDIMTKMGIILSVYPNKVFDAANEKGYDLYYQNFKNNGVCKYTMKKLAGDILGDKINDNLYLITFYQCDDGLNPAGYFFEFSNEKNNTADGGSDKANENLKPRFTKVHWKTGNKCDVYWEYSAKADGYQLYYSSNSKFSNAKTVVCKKKNCTLQGIGIRKKYYIRVRAYHIKDEDKVWSPWSHRIIVNRKR